MQFNVEFKSIKGIPIADVKTRRISEMGFPVDVSLKYNMSMNSVLSSYVSKLSDSDFVCFDIEKFYIKSLIDLKSKEKALTVTLKKLEYFNISLMELIVALQSSCLYNLDSFEAETLIEEFIFIINELLP